MKSTKLIKTRKVHKCENCGGQIKSGTLAYRNKSFEVEYEDDKKIIYDYVYYVHPKCHHKELNRKKRLNIFKDKCEHPDKFRDQVWTYIPGEAVKEPYCFGCKLCGKIF